MERASPNLVTFTISRKDVYIYSAIFKHNSKSKVASTCFGGITDLDLFSKNNKNNNKNKKKIRRKISNHVQYV